MSWEERRDALAKMWGEPKTNITDEDVLAFKNGPGFPVDPLKIEIIKRKEYDKLYPGIPHGSLVFKKLKRSSFIDPSEPTDLSIYSQIMAKSEK